MSKRNEHLVVIMLEPAKVQEFEIWPKHITIVPWFPCEDQEKLDKILHKIAAKHKPFVVEAGKTEEWGEKEKFIVQLIEGSGEIQKLHLDVYEMLERNGFFIHQKDYLGEKYKPHITLRNRYQKNDDLKIGTKINVNKFALIKQVRLKKTGRMIKSVVMEYELDG